MTNKVLLMILDGWGLGSGGREDVISQVQPAYMQSLMQRYPNAQLRTDGEAVGLPEGQMGNSEVGHLNIGAGRVLYQDLVKINRAVANHTLGRVSGVVTLLDAAKKANRLHVFGLLSDGGVHADIVHELVLVKAARDAGVENVYLHGFLDGRDTDPKSGITFVRQAQRACAAVGAKFVSMVGRYWAMDRDKRWERVQKAYDLLVHGKGIECTSLDEALLASYEAGVTDEFVEPTICANLREEGTIRAGDAVVFCNFRNDRAKQLTFVLTQGVIEGTRMTPLPLTFATMTPYYTTFKNLVILFPKEDVERTLGQWVARLGLTQLRIAETEKYAHVTFFFNGGREAPFRKERRILIPSPKVATYDQKPEMSAFEVADALCTRLEKEKFDLVVLNYANGDMVGHTGQYEAIKKAVLAVDACVQKTVRTARAHGYDVVIIADHGNADNACNADGSPNTAHSLNPVPIIVVSDRIASVQNGVLADVAPTVCHLMGLKAPARMTGSVLVA